MTKLQRVELHTLLDAAEDSFPHDLCSTCECFLGYVAQLRIDSHPADVAVFLPYKVERKDMHKCLGCDPCPPGDMYAKYIRERGASNIIAL